MAVTAFLPYPSYFIISCSSSGHACRVTDANRFPYAVFVEKGKRTAPFSQTEYATAALYSRSAY